MIAINMNNVLNYARYKGFDDSLIKALVVYLVLHEVAHVYLDTLDLYSVYREYGYFKYIPKIHDVYVHRAELTKSLSVLGLSPEDFGYEISHYVIKYRIIKALNSCLFKVSDDKLRKSLCEVIFLLSEVSRMHYNIGSCGIYDYNCIHNILSSHAKEYKKLWDESYGSLEFIEKKYNLRDLGAVIMGIVSGFFMYEHNRWLIDLTTYPLVEALCYYIPAKVLFGDIRKALLMPVVSKFYRLMERLENIGFDEVINVVRKPCCIVEKLVRLGFQEIIKGSGER